MPHYPRFLFSSFNLLPLPQVVPFDFYLMFVCVCLCMDVYMYILYRFYM